MTRCVHILWNCILDYACCVFMMDRCKECVTLKVAAGVGYGLVVCLSLSVLYLLLRLRRKQRRSRRQRQYEAALCSRVSFLERRQEEKEQQSRSAQFWLDLSQARPDSGPSPAAAITWCDRVLELAPSTTSVYSKPSLDDLCLHDLEHLSNPVELIV